MRLPRPSSVQPGGIPVWLHYLSGLIPVFVVLLIRLLLWPIVEQRSPFVLLALAVLAAAWFGGRGPGLLATAAGAIIGAFFYLDPKFSFRVAQPPEAVELAFFVLVGAGITLLAQRLRSARQAAEDTAKRKTEILESIQDGFVAIDGGTRFNYVNQAAEAILGKAKADLIGRSVWELYPELLGTPVHSEARRAIAERVPVHFEYFEPHSGRWGDFTVYPAADGGLSIYFRDITQRKLSEQALSQLAAIVSSSEDAIISVDLNGNILTWNAGAERLYGYTAEEAKGCHINLVAPPGLPDGETQLLQKLKQGESITLPGEGIKHFETTRVRKDGAAIDVSLTLSPIRDSSGAIAGASGIVRDMTQRKALEEQLRQTAKLESLGVLAGGIAHDFNNLLVGILGNASLAREMTPEASPVQPLLNDVVLAGERAATLTRQMLAYSGKGQFVTVPLDVSGLLREMATLLQSSVPRTVRLRLELAEGLPPVIADTSQLQQLVMNLVINGAEAIGDRPGVVTVSTCTEWLDGKYVCLVVEDNGSGMDETTMAKIFDPFFTTKFTGRGLGLSASLGIVRGHKGHIRVASNPGSGSVFRVLLPAAEGRIAAAVQAASLHYDSQPQIVRS